MLYAGVALAAPGGSGTVTETQHAHNVVLFEFPTANPCTGEEGMLTALADNEVFHRTFFENGSESWMTGTAEGTATFTPNNHEGVFASGHFAAWFGQATNNRNEVQHEINNFNLQGSDGSHIVIHISSHLSTNASGKVTVSFENMEAHCA